MVRDATFTLSGNAASALAGLVSRGAAVFQISGNAATGAVSAFVPTGAVVFQPITGNAAAGSLGGLTPRDSYSNRSLRIRAQVRVYRVKAENRTLGVT